MAQPGQNLTPENVHRTLLASKERGDEYFARQHKFQIVVGDLEGLTLEISTGLNTHFGIDFNEMRRKDKDDVPEGDVQFGSLRFKFYRESPNTISIFCNHPTNVLSAVFDFYNSEYGIKLERLAMFTGNIRNYVVFFTQWLASKQYPLPILDVSGTVEDPDEFKFILESFNPTERADIWARVPLGFAYDFHFTCGSVYLWNDGQWLTINNLLNKRSQRFAANHTALGNRDIREYLNRWTPRAFEVGFEYLNLELREPVDMGAIINGIQGCRLIAQSNHFSKEKRHIQFTDGRLVLLDVSHDTPQNLNMRLYPQRPDDYEREHGHMLLP